jgi:hypothetical protein
VDSPRSTRSRTRPLPPWFGSGVKTSLPVRRVRSAARAFPAFSAPVVRRLRTEGYTAFSLFTNPLTLPRLLNDLR